MFFELHQYVKRVWPKINGKLFKLLFSSSRVKIGANFQCDTWPSIIVEKSAQLSIGENVLLRRNVEIRAHKNSSIILKGNNRIDRGVRILSSNNSTITIEEGTRIGLYSILNGGDDIFIGKKVLISGFVYLQTSMHNHKKGANVQDQGYSHGPVKLESDVWLGTHVVILPNCILGNGSVVGSNAVVTKSINSGEVVGGIPAKVLKERT